MRSGACWDSGAVVANGSDAPVEELDPLAGIRAGVLRTIDEPARLAARRGTDDRAGDRRVDRRRPPGSPVTSAGEGGSCPAISPISSCCPAIRSRARPTSSSRSRSSRRWSAGAGCSSRPPGIEARLQRGWRPNGGMIRVVATRTMLQVHQSETCSVAACAEIIGAKWTVLIVHELSEGPRRFTQIEHSCAGISPRTLAERLRWLEGGGDRRPPQLRRVAAARRVRADRQGRCAPPARRRRCAASATSGSAAASTTTRRRYDAAKPLKPRDRLQPLSGSPAPGAPSPQTRTSSTTVAAAAAMSCTLAHSRSE